MTTVELSALWCVVQTAIIATLGVTATWVFSRRAPGAAATAAAGAAATVLAMTLLAPMPVPDMGDWANLVEAAGGGGAAAAELKTSSRSLEQEGPHLDFGALLARGVSAIGRMGRAEPQAAGGIEAWIGWGLVGGAVIGVLRLAAAARYVERLRRECVPVVDAASCAAFADIARRLGVRRPAALCDSRHVSSPAVLGWRRPIVLLPTNRAGWSDEHLRATLAHELAHVARGDFAWRFAASCVQAIHFFHPLVHVLTRRLALAQELAADRLAATVAGGSANYLRALSELAMRLDDRARLRAEPLVLPALSTHLTRRIAMLRSTDGSDETKRRRLMGVAAAGLIALVGAGTTALRGAAEAVAPTPAASAPAPLFARQPLHLSMLGGPHKGLFVVRVGELSQRPIFAWTVEEILAPSRELWPQTFQAEAPEFDLTAIEYVAGTPQLTIKPVDRTKDPDNPHTGRMMLGFGELIVHFSRDVAWEPWLRKHMPGSTAKSDGDLTYYELPEIPAFGKGRLLIAAVDERTLVCGGLGVDRLKDVCAGLANESTAAEAEQWAALDGGLITFVADVSHIDCDMPTPKAPQAQDVLKHVDRYGFGFDLDAATSEAGMRVAMTCADAASAEKVAEALDALLPQVKSEIESQLNVAKAEDVLAKVGQKSSQTPSLSEAEREYLRFWLRGVESCQVRVESTTAEDACVVAVTSEFSANLVGIQKLAKQAPEEDAAQR